MARERTTRTLLDIRPEVLESTLNGALVADLDRNRWPTLNGEFEIAVQAAAELHNGRSYDFLQLFTAEALRSVEAHAFFDLQHFFCALLPLVDGTPMRVATLVVAMVRKAGTDGAAGQPYVAFRKWCTQDVARPTALLSALKNDADPDFGILSETLQAGATHDINRYVLEAISLIGDASGVKRRAAAAALGKIDLSAAQDLRDEAFAALETLCTVTSDDGNCATALSSIVEMHAREPDALSQRTEAILMNSGRGPLTLHAVAGALFFHHKTLTVQMTDIALDALTGLDAGNAGTIEDVDFALSRMEYPANRERVSTFLESVALRSTDPIPVERFEHFVDTLITRQPAMLAWLAIRWLRLGQHSLCQAVSNIIQRSGGDAISLAEDLSAFSDKERLFIARKAVGFFPLQPYAAASVVVSAMRGASKQTAIALSDLLFEMVLVNYSGATDRIAALAQKAGDQASRPLKRSIKLHDEYIEGLAFSQSLPELLPSDRQRRAAYDKERAFGAHIFKQARERSILASILHNVTVLYGHRTIDYVDTGDGELKRIESQMHSHGTSWEWPRLDTVDPTGFQYRIFHMNVEQFSE